MYLPSNIVLAEEKNILRLIYMDLAGRTMDQKLDLENFLLFSRKNWYWGEELF